jgi:hypothetical protein
MRTFSGEDRQEWPSFARKLLVLGKVKGGWDVALETQLDMTVMGNKKLNKLAWSYLILNLEGDALQEIDMVEGKKERNAYAIWKHLDSKYEPRDHKACGDLKMELNEVWQEMETNDVVEKEEAQTGAVKEKEKVVIQSSRDTGEMHGQDEEDKEEQPEESKGELKEKVLFEECIVNDEMNDQKGHGEEEETQKRDREEEACKTEELKTVSETRKSEEFEGESTEEEDQKPEKFKSKNQAEDKHSVKEGKIMMAARIREEHEKQERMKFEPFDKFKAKVKMKFNVRNGRGKNEPYN